MTQDKFDTLVQEVNSKAKEYVRQQKNIRLREEIWLSLWEMRPVLFHAKAIRGYINFSPSSLYETGEEFLTEVFLEAIPQILGSYARENSDKSEISPFMHYFNIRFFRKVYDAYSDILDKTPHNYLVVCKPAIQVYLQPREDTVIPNAFLKQGMVRRILGRISDEDQSWVKTKLKKHGRTIYVHEADVECHDGASLVDINDIAEPEAPERPDERITLIGIYEDYILNLLSLVEQFYSRTQTRSNIGLSRKYCFKLLYTETVIAKLKQIYDVLGDVHTIHEKDALAVAESELLDYLLTDICRSFTSLALNTLHTYRDYEYLHSNSSEEIAIPVANIIYAHFLVDIKGINRKLDSVAPSLSKYRQEFEKQYELICNTEAIDR